MEWNEIEKLKFGEKVRCKWDGTDWIGLVVEVWINELGESCWVEVVDENGEKTDVGLDCVELISHPDTVRLDYMGKLVAESTGMQYDPEIHRRQIDESMKATQEIA